MSAQEATREGFVSQQGDAELASYVSALAERCSVTIVPNGEWLLRFSLHSSASPAFHSFNDVLGSCLVL